jgi:hypothetical protein
MKLYIASPIVFLILINAASGAVGGMNAADTVSTNVPQQISSIGADLQAASTQSFAVGSQGNYQSTDAISQSKGSAYPIPQISNPTDEQLTAENLGLSIPQMDSFTPDESLGFVSVTGPSRLAMQSGSSSVQAINSGSSVWYYPSSVASANRFYVQSNSGLSTVGGCGYSGYLPLWADIKTSGNFYVYEWYPGQSTYSVHWWGWTEAGWKKGWFSGDKPGWHILCYNSGIWSNYIYIYVYQQSASVSYASASGSLTASSLPSGAPTPIDPSAEGLIMPDFNLYRPVSSTPASSYNYPSAASITALAGNQAIAGAAVTNPSLSPSLVSYPYLPLLGATQGKMSTVNTAKTCTTCNTCTSSTSIAGGVSSICPYNAGSSSCSASVGGSAPAGYVAKSLQATYPQPSVCKCNEYFVQVCDGDLETVAGVFSGEWLPLWSKVNRAGEYWSFEWTICSSSGGYYCSPEAKSFGKKNVGWHETWFKGSDPGWHILSYHCNDWSNYVYIYVWPAD